MLCCCCGPVHVAALDNTNGVDVVNLGRVHACMCVYRHLNSVVNNLHSYGHGQLSLTHTKGNG
jgi:hypothetical protein